MKNLNRILGAAIALSCYLIAEFVNLSAWAARKWARRRTLKGAMRRMGVAKRNAKSSPFYWHGEASGITHFNIKPPEIDHDNFLRFVSRPCTCGEATCPNKGEIITESENWPDVLEER